MNDLKVAGNEVGELVAKEVNSEVINANELIHLLVDNSKVIRQLEKENLMLQKEVTRLNAKYTNISSRYNALSNSKLGKLTRAFWKIKRKIFK